MCAAIETSRDCSSPVEASGPWTAVVTSPWGVIHWSVARSGIASQLDELLVAAGYTAEPTGDAGPIGEITMGQTPLVIISFLPHILSSTVNEMTVQSQQ